MKLTESQIEDILHHAPQPATPAGLKEKLVGGIRLSATATATPQNRNEFAPPLSWWRRWWPALAPATAALAGVAVIAVQQHDISTLKQTIQALEATVTATTSKILPTLKPVTQAESSVDPATVEAAEIERLKQRVASLTAEIGALEATKSANEKLKMEAAKSVLTQGELDALASAKDRAQSTACVNNLKQIGLAVRLWTMEHNDVNPPDFLSMSNELSTPKILFCPAHTNNAGIKTWTEFANTVSSYQFLAAGAVEADAEPQRISVRCPYHNNLGLVDGSVQRVSKQHPEFIIERDGKLYLDMSARPTNPNPTP